MRVDVVDALHPNKGEWQPFIAWLSIDAVQTCDCAISAIPRVLPTNAVATYVLDLMTHGV